MALEKFILKIVSDLDETGFEKLDNLQSEADKSVKNLSNSLKSLFNIKIGTNLYKDLGKIADDAEILNKSLKNFTLLDPNSGEEFPNADKRSKSKKSIDLSSIFVVNKLNSESSGISKFFTSFLNSGGLSLTKIYDKFFNSKQNQYMDFQVYDYGTKYDKKTSTLFPFFNILQPVSRAKIYSNTINRAGNNFLNNTSVNDFVKEIYSAQNLLSDGQNVMGDIFSFENISSMNNVLSSPQPVISQPEYTTNSTESQTVDNSSIDSGLSLNIEQGAIQINTTSDNPQQIGESVRAALTGALDDFILKRGYKKAV